MLSPASRFLAPNATRRSIRRLWGLEGSAMRWLSVALAVRCHSRPSYPIHRYSIAYQTLRETLLDPYTGKVDETTSEHYMKLMLVVSLTESLISHSN
jgi:hypothetical protein